MNSSHLPPDITESQSGAEHLGTIVSPCRAFSTCQVCASSPSAVGWHAASYCTALAVRRGPGVAGRAVSHHRPDGHSAPRPTGQINPDTTLRPPGAPGPPAAALTEEPTERARPRARVTERRPGRGWGDTHGRGAESAELAASPPRREPARRPGHRHHWEQRR